MQRQFLALWFSLAFLLTTPYAFAAAWIAVDWQGKEPNFPPGSLFWRTNEFRRCPVVYRTALDVANKSVASAGFRVQAKQYVYVFLNGRQIAAVTAKESEAVRTEAEIVHLLKPGRNVLLVSASADGFSLEGGIFYRAGAPSRFSSEPRRWKAQKFPPLTVLEDEACLKPDFDDANWFPVRVADGEPLTVSNDELRAVCERLASERLRKWDEEARWRLQMLASKGIAVVDWEAHGWAGAVTVRFDQPNAQLFLLRPLKEWRGLLGQAKAMTQDPLRENEVQRYVQPCRLWSRALLNYPVTFSETFVRDPNDRWAILVADVYNYRELKDDWGTRPLRLAPLPPLATYGLMKNYPGLKVLSKAETLGSRGVWGDEIAAENQNYIVYRVPLDPIQRFGGFTAYCFGPTDIGEPGSATELDLIKRTGSNTFRPQHNQTGERALRTARWAWERGLQNVFNTDEKWVPDVVEHYRALAEQCKDFPPDAIAYDLLNEPETREPRAYNALIKKVTNAIRAVDKTHLIYVEAMPPWGPGAQPFPQGAFETLEPTGDPLTVYSFHDYEYRLPPRWPHEQSDIRNLLSRWIPAFRFSIDHRAPIHLGEFGGFEQTKQNVYDNPCAVTLLMDYFKIFDQFGWHFHYYSHRGVVRVRGDGSVQESYVQAACRRYFARGMFNVNRRD